MWGPVCNSMVGEVPRFTGIGPSQVSVADISATVAWKRPLSRHRVKPLEGPTKVMCVESLKLQRSSISLIATVTASIDVCGDRGRGFCHDAVESPVSDERGRNICHGQVIWPILNDCGKSGCHGEAESGRGGGCGGVALTRLPRRGGIQDMGGIRRDRNLGLGRSATRGAGQGRSVARGAGRRGSVARGTGEGVQRRGARARYSDVGTNVKGRPQ